MPTPVRFEGATVQELILQIENFGALEDGSPVEFRVPAQGALVGRHTSMDWCLPDPSRQLSRKHFEVRSEPETGSFWIIDRSKAGTYLFGHERRLRDPHPVIDGDRFTVGRYTILARFAPGETVSPRPQVASPDDAVLPREIAANKTYRNGSIPGFSSTFGQEPNSPPDERNSGVAQPDVGRQHGVQLDPISRERGLLESFERGSPQDAERDRPTGVQLPPVMTGWDTAPAQTAAEAPGRQIPDQAMQVSETPVRSRTAEAPATGQSLPTPRTADAPGKAFGATPSEADYIGGENSDRFFQAFLDGAGLPSDTTLEMTNEDFARNLGHVARIVSIELRAFLKDRSMAKEFAAPETRTMSSRNPLKAAHLQDIEAFKLLFLSNDSAWSMGPEATHEALEDLKGHHAALMHALQPALSEMLSGLAPQDIESVIAAGWVQSASAKCWEEYEKRWETRAASGDGGMLHAFVAALSRHYREYLLSQS